MFLKKVTMGCAAAALMAVPMEPAQADSRDFAAGIVAGVVGSAVVRNAQKQKRVVRTQRTQRTYRAPSISTAQRAQNREVQTALNYFSFPVGTVDGALGPRSRGAISNYQVHMGYPATGYLTDYERSFLVSSYHRAISGGATTSQLIAARGGPRGVLHHYRDEAAGVTTAAAPAAVVPVAPAPATTVVVAPQAATPQVVSPQPATTTTTTTVTAAAPSVTVTAPAATLAATGGDDALPNFFGKAEVQSLASHCNQVSLLTSTNGGFTTVDGMVDASFALNEQFCLARTYAISQGEELITKIQGVSSDQITAQCEGFAPAMKEHIAALSLKPHTEVMQGVSGFVLNSGMSPAQLSGTAKICLSVGYRTDNMDVALGSALILAVTGEQVYGELMGHHLAQGFGATKRTDLALAWYEMGLSAVENGATSVFAPGQPERNALIRKATYSLGDTSQSSLEPEVKETSGSALPTFNISQ